MVSTRQMTIGNNSGNSSGETSAHHQPQQQGLIINELGPPAKSTRNSSSAFGGPSKCRIQSVPAIQQSVHLLDLPDEVVGKIFSYLTFENVCQLRLVNHRVHGICGHILNSTFQRLQNQMLQRFHDIKQKMPRRESARRSHHLACESDLIETIHMRLSLLQMTFGKHIERKHCFFFPGQILDEVYRILNYIKITPKPYHPYRVTDEFFDLSTMAMEYFKENIEPKLPDIACFSGLFKYRKNCAIVDIRSRISSFSSSKQANQNTDEEEIDDDPSINDVLDNEDLVETTPQSTMVLRKRIRKIKQGMRRYNSQLSILTQDLRTCKRKTSEQQKQISEQQKQLADQQKQTLECATRLDEYDKKNEEMSRKFSTLLQELNKCKTELQYYRCKSPAATKELQSICTNCGTAITPRELQTDEAADLAAFVEADTTEMDLLEGKVNESTLVESFEVSTGSTSKGVKRKFDEASVNHEEEMSATSNPAGNRKTRRHLKIRHKRFSK